MTAAGLAGLVLLAAGWATADPAKLARGREAYVQACAQCHGQDGAGNPDWESAVRPVDLRDCGTTAEPFRLWTSIVANGGPRHGLSSVMPAFGDAYTPDEVSDVVAYLRTFCPDADRYPPGDLNFRRPLKTGKAFPEVEVVLRASHRPKSASRETELELSYENRVGPRFQYEVVMPLRPQASGNDGRGVGDIELEAKQVLHFDLARLAIVSGGLGLKLPTGSENKGLGSGTLAFAPFVSLGKGFAGGQTFVQAKLGAELPADTAAANRELKYAVALSHAFGLPRTAWTPAVEWVGAYDTQLDRLEHAAWLELSKPLNKLGHVIASVGVQVPIRPKADTYRVEVYVLWDFGDGPFWVGW